MIAKNQPDLPGQKPADLRGSQQFRAYDVLKEMIILQELPGGSMVSEQALSTHLGFGRSPIRWALQKLSLEGLVAILPQRGVFVTQINVETQLKLLEVRAELERLMVKGAARRATPAQRQAMLDMALEIEQVAEQSDGRAFMSTLKAIHDLTAQAANNEILRTAIDQIQGLSRRFWFAHYQQHGDLNIAASLHAERLRAIASADQDDASAASDKLVDYLEDFTRSTLAFGSKGTAMQR